LCSPARAYGLDALDGVYNDIKDLKGLEGEARDGRAMGFDGKTLIHPAQISPVNDIFSVDAEQRAEAEAIVAAFMLDSNRDRGVISLNGRMVERLHLDMAERLLRKVRLAEARDKGDQAQ
jgi:citrate lyase subunit beta/citryl-CoA lyase